MAAHLIRRTPLTCYIVREDRQWWCIVDPHAQRASRVVIVDGCYRLLASLLGLGLSVVTTATARAVGGMSAGCAASAHSPSYWDALRRPLMYCSYDHAPWRQEHATARYVLHTHQFTMSFQQLPAVVRVSGTAEGTPGTAHTSRACTHIISWVDERLPKFGKTVP